MLDFEVQRCTRRCAKSGREIRPGESLYSVLVPDGDQVKRLDYAAECWECPPDRAIAWWKSRLPGGDVKRDVWAPHDVMLDYFQSLEMDESRADVRYVLALLLVRKRILRLEQMENQSGVEVSVLYCPRIETEYRVRVSVPSEARAAEIQMELERLLLTPAA
jgi:hypothetical protein